MQNRIELELLHRRDAILDSITKAENQLMSNEIIGKDTSDSLRELQQLQSGLGRHDRLMFDELESIKVKQQTLLQRSGIPQFRMSNDAIDLRNQYWMLAPYLDLMPTLDSL